VIVQHLVIYQLVTQPYCGQLMILLRTSSQQKLYWPKYGLVPILSCYFWKSFSSFIIINIFNYTRHPASPRLNKMVFAHNNLFPLSGVLLIMRTITELDMVIFSTLCQTTKWLFDLGLLLT